MPTALLAPSDRESNDPDGGSPSVIAHCPHGVGLRVVRAGTPGAGQRARREDKELAGAREAAYGACVNASTPSARFVEVDEAIDILRRGGLVALPTETVYGLGADALDPSAVARIFSVKGRPTSHPLIVHLADADHLPGWAEVPDEAWLLAERFWPGPLTLVLPRGPLALDAVTGGLGTIGLRVPAHPLTRAVLLGLGSGVAAPSANRFGRISPTTAQHVAADLGVEVDGILDGGPCEVGIESTIVDMSRADGPAVLRQGAITREALAEALGRPVGLRTHADVVGGEERAVAPGQLASHYAPRARLELAPRERIAELARGLSTERVVILGDAELGTDAERWARNLYAALRDADARGPDVILVPVPPAGALAAAVLDRLTRAAAPRSG